MGVAQRGAGGVFAAAAPATRGEALPVLEATLMPATSGFPAVAAGEVLAAAVVSLRQAMGMHDGGDWVMQEEGGTGGPDGPPTLAFLVHCQQQPAASWSAYTADMPCGASNLGAVVTATKDGSRLATAPRVWFRRPGHLASVMTAPLRNSVFMFVPLLQHTRASIADTTLHVQVVGAAGAPQAGVAVGDAIVVHLEPALGVSQAQAANPASEEVPDSGVGGRGVTACIVRAAGSGFNDNAVLDQWLISAAIAGVAHVHVYDVHGAGVDAPGTANWKARIGSGLAQHTDWTDGAGVKPKSLPDDTVCVCTRVPPFFLCAPVAALTKVACCLPLSQTGRPHATWLQPLLAAPPTLLRVAVAGGRASPSCLPTVLQADWLAAAPAEATWHAQHGRHPLCGEEREAQQRRCTCMGWRVRPAAVQAWPCAWCPGAHRPMGCRWPCTRCS